MALGGKLLGAGQGGFLLFYVAESEQDRLHRALAELDECDVEFDDAGTTIITTTDPTFPTWPRWPRFVARRGRSHAPAR